MTRRHALAWWRRVAESLPLAAGSIALLAFGLMLAVERVGLLQPLELRAYDFALDWRAHDLPPDPRVVVVTIGEDDIQRLGWPLSDALLARLVERLSAAGSAAVALDLYRDLPVGEGRAQLDAALAAHPSVIGAEKFPDVSGAGVAPPAALADTDRVGFTDMLLDADGKVRRGLLYLFQGERVGTALAFRAVLALLAASDRGVTPDPDGNPMLGSTVFKPLEADFGPYVGADAGGYQYTLDFGGAPQGHAELALARVLDNSQALDLAGRIVFVGVVARSVNDSFAVPVGNQSVLAPRLPGVHLHAAAADQLLRLAEGRSRLLREWPRGAELAWLGTVCTLAATVAASPLSFAGLTLVLGSGLAVVAGVGLAMLVHGYWLPVALPGLGWLLVAGLVVAFRTVRERADRVLVMQLFERQVSPTVAAEVWRQRRELFRDGQMRTDQLTATVLFSDLVGFTTLSERLPPEALLARLNEYMEEMSQCVLGNGGMVDKFIGDAVMAVYGVPVPSLAPEDVARDARAAVRTALQMAQRLDAFNRRRPDLPPLSMRVGIATGELVAGTLGSRERQNYTVIGDTVNTAARLESFDKHYNPEADACRILITGRTRALLDAEFRVESVGAQALKGKEDQVEIFLVRQPLEIEETR